MKEARALSKARAKAAPQLAKAVTQAMQGLGMQGGRFEVALQTMEQPARGLEEISFLVAATPAARRGRSARWRPAANCRASRWPSP